MCSAFSVAGSISTKAYLEVTAMANEPPPIIKVGPANQTLPVNTLAILPCEASGNNYFYPIILFLFATEFSC